MLHLFHALTQHFYSEFRLLPASLAFTLVDFDLAIRKIKAALVAHEPSLDAVTAERLATAAYLKKNMMATAPVPTGVPKQITVQDERGTTHQIIFIHEQTGDGTISSVEVAPGEVMPPQEIAP